MKSLKTLNITRAFQFALAGGFLLVLLGVMLAASMYLKNKYYDKIK